MAIKTYVDEDGNLATFDPASSLKMSEIKAEFTGDSTPSLGEYFREGGRVRSHDFLHTYKGAYALGFYAERNTPDDTSKMDIKYHIPGVTAAGQITTLSDQSVVPGGTLTYGDNSQYQFKVSNTLLQGSSTRYGVKLRVIKNIGIPTKTSGAPVPISFSDFYGTERATAVPLDAEVLTINVSSNFGRAYDGYNLKDELEKFSAWDDPNVLVNEVIVNIDSGTVLGSTDTSVAGFTIADLPEQLKITVNVNVGAIIFGCGGAGGDAPLNNPMNDAAAKAEARGKPGGPAVKIDHPVGMVYFNIEDRTAFNKNSQSILGGGGGGAAGYTTDSNGVAYGSGGGGGAGGGKGGSCRSGGTVVQMTDPGYRSNFQEWKGLAGISSRRATNPDDAYLVEPQETIAGGAGGSVVRNLKRLGTIDWYYKDNLSTTNGQTVEQVLQAFHGGQADNSKVSAGNNIDVPIPNLAGSAFVRHNYAGKHTRIFVIVDGRIKYADVGMRNNWAYTANNGYGMQLYSQAIGNHISHSNGQFSHKWVEYRLNRKGIAVSPTSYTTNFTVSTGANGAVIPKHNASIATGIGKNFWSGGTATEEAIDLSNIDLTDITLPGSPGSGRPLFDLNHISDENLKQNIKNVSGALDKVCSLNGVTFNYKHDGKQSAGVIAQQVEKVLPSAVLTNNTGDEEYKTVEYHQLSALFIESIKQLKAENEELRLMIKDLKEK